MWLLRVWTLSYSSIRMHVGSRHLATYGLRMEEVAALKARLSPTLSGSQNATMVALLT
jgi:hypothetical protein